MGRRVLVSSIDPGPDRRRKARPACGSGSSPTPNGDGKADKRERLYGPFGTRDTHGMVNSFTLMPDGWVYACHGYRNEDKVKGRDGHEVSMQSGSTFRFRPDGSRIEVFTRGQVNPFGITLRSVVQPLQRRLPFQADHAAHSRSGTTRASASRTMASAWAGHDSTTITARRGLCGLSLVRGRTFPKEFQGGMFLGNVVNSRINWDKIKFHGSTPEAIEQPDFLVSDDFWFRPVDIKLGPDGTHVRFGLLQQDHRPLRGRSAPIRAAIARAAASGGSSTQARTARRRSRNRRKI